MGGSGREGASRWFFGVWAALVEEVAKRFAGKPRLGLLRSLVARAEADGEPKLAVKRLLMAAQFLLAAQRRRRRSVGGVSGEGGAAKIGGDSEADAGSEAGVVAEPGMEAGICFSEAGL